MIRRKTVTENVGAPVKAGLYESDIVLGEKYRDEQTGFQGVATSVTFFQYACERIALEDYDAQRKSVKTEIFDAPRLSDVETGVRATAALTGGPGEPVGQRGPLSR